MELRHRLVPPLVGIALGFALGPAFAAKPTPAPSAVPPGGAPVGRQLGPTTRTSPACQMGVTPPSVLTFDYLQPPQDAFYTLLVPGACPVCPAPSAPLFTMSTAHVQLSFTESCQISVDVAIVGALELSPGCLAPNPLDIRCPPTTYILNDGGVLDDCVDFSMPLPPGCCLEGPTFLSFEFNATDCPALRPAFCGPATCQNCTQYNDHPGGPPGGEDLCAILGGSGIHGVVMYVDAFFCCADPAMPGTWGLVKTLYR
jgi:hypothetical protein